jgi:rhodanese-related sulfurtransferase
VQATDQYAGTLGARIVLVDDAEVRAVMTASWLKQMGWKDVAVLAETGTEAGTPAAPVLGAKPPAGARIDCTQLESLLQQHSATVVDLSLSPNYRKAHIAGAWFAIRSRLAKSLPKIPVQGELVLTSEDGILAGVAVAEVSALAGRPVRYLTGGNAAWQAAGLPFSTDANMADDPLDVWLKPYERTGDTKDAMSEYLSWEVDLVQRIARDGTCHFTH